MAASSTGEAPRCRRSWRRRTRPGRPPGRALKVGLVTHAQRAGQLPAGDPERLASLLLAPTHRAVDLALADHLSPAGKGRAGPDDLAEDLFGYLEAAALQRNSV